jgi:uncharacterized protein YlxW (UPF0749 family)
MATLQTISIVVTLIGVIIMVYRSIFSPQARSDKNDAVLSEEIKAIRAELANLRDNHIHSLETKLDKTNEAVRDLSIQMARLNTIIEERIPRKI